MSKNKGDRAATGKNPTQDDNCIKVKYISSPVMVEAKNPSEFKEIVQHFTGQTTKESNFNNYSNPTTTTAATTTAATTTADTTTIYNTNPQAGIDGYSWEEIAAWNQH